MFNRFFSFFKSSAPAAVRGRYDDLFVLHVEDTLDRKTPRWPPFVEGLQTLDTYTLMKTQSRLIQEIQQVLRFNRADFSKLVMPVIENYAEFVNTLPASEAHHHRGEGGLFRHGLEVGLFAAKSADSHQFCKDDIPEVRRANEPRWQLAAFLGGLMHDIGKPLSDVTVTDRHGNIEWQPYAAPLSVWLRDNGLERYFLRWRQKRHRRHEKHTSMFIPTIIPKETSAYLNTPPIYDAFADAIVGDSLDEPLARIVISADQESVRRDLTEQQLDPDEFSHGVPVERFIFDALRVYVNSNESNKPGGLIWTDEKSVYINWHKMVPVLLVYFAKEKIPGIPRDPDTLADILLEKNYAVPSEVVNDVPTGRYWRVYPEPLHGVGVNGLRFDRFELIFRSVIPAPIDISHTQPQSKPGSANEAPSQVTGNEVVAAGSSGNPDGVVVPPVQAANPKSKQVQQVASVPADNKNNGKSSAVQKSESKTNGQQLEMAPPPYHDDDSGYGFVEWGSDSSGPSYYDYEGAAGDLSDTPPVQQVAPTRNPQESVGTTPWQTQSVQVPVTPAITIINKAIELYTSNKACLREFTKGVWVIEHPSSTGLLGETPGAVLGALKAESFITPDKVTGNMVTNLDGQFKCLVLSDEPKRLVQSALEGVTPVQKPSQKKEISDSDLIKQIIVQLHAGCGSLIGEVIQKPEESLGLVQATTLNANLKALGVTTNSSILVLLGKVPGFAGQMFEGQDKFYKFTAEAE